MIRFWNERETEQEEREKKKQNEILFKRISSVVEWGSRKRTNTTETRTNIWIIMRGMNFYWNNELNQLMTWIFFLCFCLVWNKNSWLQFINRGSTTTWSLKEEKKIKTSSAPIIWVAKIRWKVSYMLIFFGRKLHIFSIYSEFELFSITN